MPRFSDAVEDFIGFAGPVAIEPIGEELFHSVGKANEGVECGSGAVVGSGFEDGGSFVIIESGNPWGEGNTDGDAGAGEGFEGLEAGIWGRSAGFERGGELRIQGGDGDEDSGGFVFSCEVTEEVCVAGDEVIFRDDGDWVAESGEHFKAATGDFEFSFDGLVGIGDAAADERFWLPRWMVEFVGEEFGCVFLDDDAGLEVDSGIEAQVFVVRAGVAIGASVFAAAVGIEAGLNAEVGAVVGGDNGLGIIAIDIGFEGAWGGIWVGDSEVFRSVGIGFDVERFEAVGG